VLASLVHAGAGCSQGDDRSPAALREHLHARLHPRAGVTTPTGAGDIWAAPEPLAVPEAVAALYQRRDFAPIWFAGDRPNAAARKLLGFIYAADRQGLDPEEYHASALRRL